MSDSAPSYSPIEGARTITQVIHHTAWSKTKRRLDMSKRGEVVEHPVTGERITFLETAEETNGEYALLGLRVKAHGFVAAPHVHPRLQETFEILKGTFTFLVDGEKREVNPGEGTTVPAGSPHAWWNSGEEEGVAVIEFRPALKAEEFFETFFGLAQDGKVSPKTGLPNVLWLAVILRSYRDFLYLAKPPLPVQRAIVTPLAAVARLLGHKLPYPYPYSRSAEVQGRHAVW
jgi:mannose-6-phosphate isomerase-like protein (cupin superfamily)